MSLYSEAVSRVQFVRYGTARHLKIADAEDLRRVLNLTRTRWIATAAPIAAFDLADEFLSYLDTDRDGRILPHELRAAIAWTLAVLSRYDGLNAGGDRLALDHIATDHPDGGRIVRAIRHVLDGTDRPASGASPGAVTQAELRTAIAVLTKRTIAEAQALQPPEAYLSLAPKIDEFFFLSRVAATTGEPVSYQEPLTAALRTFDVSAIRTALGSLPLATPSPAAALPIASGTNPAYDAAISRFRTEIVEPILGDLDYLTEDGWRTIVERYSPAPVPERYADDVACLNLAVKLASYQKNLLRFANSFVSCPDLYHADRRAAFEAGTLYLDGYALTFAVKVPDRRFHAEIARQSNIFVVYAAVYATGTPAYEIAVPVTNGTGRRLFRGKHGVFLDRHGREWNAEIVEIVTNPIGLIEAVIGPFRRLGEIFTGRFGAAAKDAEAGLDRAAAAAVVSGHQAAPADQVQPTRPGGLGAAGSIAGLGLAVAAVTSAFAFITSALSGIPWWHILIGIGAAVFAVVLPALVSAMIKLSRRDLSVILEGTKWSVNSPLRLTRRQGRFFTRKAPKRRKTEDRRK